VRALRTLVLAGVAAAALTAGIGSAMADPSTTPAENSIVAVGSDTIEFQSDQASIDYNATSPAPTNKFYSWDAVNPTTGAVGDTIDTKNSPACDIARPNGSGAGIAQLQAKKKTTDGTENCVDIARASRNIQASDGAGIVSVLFAHDLITWSANAGGNAVTNLTDTDLKAIYECNASLISSSFSGPVKWNEVGGTSADAIIPVLPQASSGTRSQWQTDIGVPNASLGSCVVQGAFAGTTIEENEGTNPVFTSTGNPTGFKDALFPFSGGDYVCQLDTKKCPDQHGTLTLGQIDGKAPITSANVINTSGLTAFPALYIRGLYYVALNAGGTGVSGSPAPAVPNGSNLSGYTIDLTKFLGQGNSSGWICGTAGQADTKAFGFATVSNCGSLTGQ
jgi:ABC-type phosphate transport system substrate-binding protein